MTTQTRVLPDLDESLDFDLECDHENCSFVARWMGSATCGCTWAFVCDPHKKYWDDIQSGPTHCGRCLTNGARVTWRPL